MKLANLVMNWNIWVFGVGVNYGSDDRLDPMWREPRWIVGLFFGPVHVRLELKAKSYSVSQL